MARSPDLVWAGPLAPSRRPEHGRFSPPSAPRRTHTGVEHGPAKGVPHSRRTLPPAPKRHGTDQIVAWYDSSSKDTASRARAPPQQLAALAPCEAHRTAAEGQKVTFEAVPHSRTTHSSSAERDGLGQLVKQAGSSAKGTWFGSQQPSRRSILRSEVDHVRCGSSRRSEVMICSR